VPLRLLVVAVGASILLATPAAARSEPAFQPRLEISGPSAASVGQPVELTISVSGAGNLAGYETALLFDAHSARMSGLALKQSDLRRTGRSVLALGPQEIDEGVAFGQVSRPRARRLLSRTARLATVWVTPTRLGRLELRLAASKLVDVAGRELKPTAASPITIAVGGPGRTIRLNAPPAPWRLAAASRASRPRAVDLTHDGAVGQADAMTVVHAWTMTRIGRHDPCHPSPSYRSSDVNRDGCIDVADLQSVTSRSGRGSVRQRSSGRRSAGEATGITVTVDSTGDQPDVAPNDGVCATAAGSCSLRAAIETANRHPGDDRVEFHIGHGGRKTIRIGSTLPIINEQGGSLTIDGYTQRGASPNTAKRASNADIAIQLTGPGERHEFPALYITSANNTVRGLAVYGFWRAIWLDGPGAHHNAIVGNFIGTNAAGTYHSPRVFTSNGSMVLSGGASENWIGRPNLADRNVISGSPASGVYHTHEGTRFNVVQNNIIGLNPSGTDRISNRLEGVDYNLGASDNLDGGTGPLERNVQSGNFHSGAEISHGTNTLRNQIVGNFMGTDLAGNRSPRWAANRDYGVHVEDGSTASEVRDNVILGNWKAGISIDGTGTNDTLVTGNRIGIGQDGTAAGNQVAGIRIWLHARAGVIADNVIAHNPVGIEIEDRANQAFTLSRNRIYRNAAAGIDLAPGSNHRVRFPAVGLAAPSRIAGTACPGCIIEVFVADAGSGTYGEGRAFLGSGMADEQGAFSIPVSGVRVGQAVTATATDPSGNTSEFAINVLVTRAGRTFAADAFSRSLADRWGVAEVGGGWVASARSPFDVHQGVGTIQLGRGSTRAATLAGVQAQSLDVRFRFRPLSVPRSGVVQVVASTRRQRDGSEYRTTVRIDAAGQVRLGVDRVIDGETHPLGSDVLVPGLRASSSRWIHVRVLVSGTDPTTIHARAWATGSAEPSSWLITRTDEAARLQRPGAVGLRASLSRTASGATTILFDDFRASRP
jgi:CSLREA domain-containing protein